MSEMQGIVSHVISVCLNPKGSLCKITHACTRASANSGLKQAKFSLGLLPFFLFLFIDHLFNMPEIAKNDKIMKPILLDF
jgi:hypothetical protein